MINIGPQTEVRPIGAQDAPEFFRLIDRNRPYLRQWLGWVDGTKTIADLQGFIEMRMKLAAEKTDLCKLIWNAGKIVGIVHLVGIDAQNKKAMIGYWVGEEFRGRGFAKQATEALIDQAFSELGLNRIEIRCATGNRASQAIPKALGFREEGLLRENEWLNDHFVDHLVFSVLAKEW